MKLWIQNGLRLLVEASILWLFLHFTLPKMPNSLMIVIILQFLLYMELLIRYNMNLRRWKNQDQDLRSAGLVLSFKFFGIKIKLQWIFYLISIITMLGALWFEYDINVFDNRFYTTLIFLAIGIILMEIIIYYFFQRRQFAAEE